MRKRKELAIIIFVTGILALVTTLFASTLDVFNLTEENGLQSNDVKDVFVYDITKDSIDYSTWYGDINKSWWQEINDGKAMLLLWNKMGSDAQVTNSEIGPNGTIYGTLDYAANKFGNGVNTTGLTNYIDFDNINTGNQKWTIDFYFTPLRDYIYGSTTTHEDAQWVMGYDSTDTYRYAFYWTGLYRVLATDLGSTRLTLTYPGVSLEANRTYHIRLVADRSLPGSSRHKLFIDGVFQNPTVHADWGNVDESLKRLRFGAHLEDTPTLDGSAIFDNVKVYNYANLNLEDRHYENNNARSPHFPRRSYLIATDSGLDIVDSCNNSVWMSFQGRLGNALPDTDQVAVSALDGKVFVANETGLYEIDFINDTIIRTDSSGVAYYNGSISERNDGKEYGPASGTGIVDSAVHDIALATDYAFVGTDAGVSLIDLSTRTVCSDSGNACHAVAILGDDLVYHDNDQLLRKDGFPLSDFAADDSTYLTGINDIVANDDAIFVGVEGGGVVAVDSITFTISEQIVKSDFDDSQPNFWNKMEVASGGELISEIGPDLTLVGTNYDVENAMFNDGWDNNAESTYANAPASDLIPNSSHGAVEWWWVPDDDAVTTLGVKGSWFFSNAAISPLINDRWYFEAKYVHWTSPPIFEISFAKRDSYGGHHACNLSWPYPDVLHTGNWKAGDRVHLAFAWHNENVILGKFICAFWVNGELLQGFTEPNYLGTLEGWRTTNPATPAFTPMRIGDSIFPYTADEQLRGPMDNIIFYDFAKDDWGSRHIEDGSVTKVFAGESGNVRALALEDDDMTLYAGTNDGDDGGGISMIDTPIPALLYTWTSSQNEELVDYDINALSFWQDAGLADAWDLLAGTENGASVLSPLDSDGDGIADLVDGEFVSGEFVDQSTVFSDNFTDQHLSGTSFGFIVSRGNLVLTVVEEPNPNGVHLTATSGSGTARVKGCGISKPIRLTSGDEVIVTCSSMSVQVLAGPVEIELSEDVFVTAPAGTTVTITELGSEQVEVQNNSPEGTEPILITIGDQVIELDPGESRIVCSMLPTIALPIPLTLECNSMGGIPASDQQIQEWLASSSAFSPCGDVSFTNDAPDFFPVGTTTVTFTALDEFEGMRAESSTVTIVDTTSPEISVSLDPTELWPPNHRMVDVTATVVATDICSIPTIILASVTNSEPDNAPGNGDGDTGNDIQGAEIGTADYEFMLRAERDGSGNGRHYTAIYTATDAYGNESSASSVVNVPHDKGGKTDPINAEAQESSIGTLLTWSKVEDALHYNICRGILSNIRETELAIELGPMTCIEFHSLDRTTQGWEDTETPELGEVFFYLVEYDNGSRSSYGTESTPKPRVPNSGDCE